MTLVNELNEYFNFMKIPDFNRRAGNFATVYSIECTYKLHFH